MSIETLTIVGAVLGIVASIIAIVSDLFGIGTSLKNLFGRTKTHGSLKYVDSSLSNLKTDILLAGTAGALTAVGALEAAKKLGENSVPTVASGDITYLSDAPRPPSTGLSLDDIIDLT